MRLEFTIPGKPVPKGRPRVVRSKTGKVRTFTPKRTSDYERHAAACALAARTDYECSPERARMQGWIMDWIYGVTLRVFGARANADLDNVAKACVDSFEGILYGNDKRVRRLVVERCEGKPPRVEVTVEVLA